MIKFDYQEPANLEEVFALLAKHGLSSRGRASLSAGVVPHAEGLLSNQA